MKILILLYISMTFLSLAAADLFQFAYSNALIVKKTVNFTCKTESVTFFAIGDMGGSPVLPFNTIIGTVVSLQMRKQSEKVQPNFNILLGDNFYFDGVENDNDYRFKLTFNSYLNSDTLKNIPWLITLGNHDYYGNAQAQVDYSKKSNTWIMPDFNYTVNVKTKSQKQLMTIMMIDTIKMCGNVPKSDTLKQPEFTSTDEQNRAAAYLADFEQKLSAISLTKVPYIVVAGHFPVWSVSSHGPTQCLVDKVRPLLHKYRVSAYISGHDHNLQHIQDTYLGQTVHYIVSGAGSYSDSTKKSINKVPKKSLKFLWSDKIGEIYGGFVIVQATSKMMSIQFMHSNGTNMQTVSINPR